MPPTAFAAQPRRLTLQKSMMHEPSWYPNQDGQIIDLIQADGEDDFFEQFVWLTNL
ncbi:hypothetical protein [Candidatus Pseudomonas adelgestsugas]|uniref:hypothetical protein n=1 Tax=Candidatus Pseudomonas adelgestsugas TaxID=1302376 RepID=UPI001300249F|nr:hypothetical protein [Candidatus Pseudomonas adelgestsugas]